MNYCTGMDNGCFWPRGKMLGGSSSLNAMAYVRGNSRDYNNWNAMGNPTWDWPNVLKYFKKSEDLRVPAIINSPSGIYYGTGGPLKVEDFHNKDPMRDVLMNAGKELGFKILQDTSIMHIGLEISLGTFDNGSRCSSAKAFLSPSKNRTNLHVIKYAHVTKLVMDVNLGTAIGVQFKLNDKLYTAKQRKEVILSAGSIGTPHLLMLSGIGGAKCLKTHAIESTVHLPGVGRNLQDHLYVPLNFKVHNETSFSTTPNDIEVNMLEYIRLQSGPLTKEGLFDLTGYFNTINETNAYPNIQVFCRHIRKGDTNIYEGSLLKIGYNANLAALLVNMVKDSELFQFNIVNISPKSHGFITLRSADPFVHPIIKPKYFSHPDDLSTMIGSIRFMQKFQETISFRQQKVEEVKVELPECGLYGTDAYWECYIRTFATTLYHPVGTAKMGPNSDKMAVVDWRLRVKGTKNVRVVDASIMPKIISGNTNAPTIMIGEKAADFIKQDWNV